MVQKRVLGVIGLGHVGAHVAYALAIQGIADEARYRTCATPSRICPTASPSAPVTSLTSARATSSSTASARSSCCAARMTA